MANTLPRRYRLAPGMSKLCTTVNVVSTRFLTLSGSAVSLQVLWLRLLHSYPCVMTLSKSRYIAKTPHHKKRRKNIEDKLTAKGEAIEIIISNLPVALPVARPQLLDASPTLSPMFLPRRSRLFPDPKLGSAIRSPKEKTA